MAKPARQQAADYIAYNSRDQTQHKVQAKKVRALVRSAIGSQERRIYYQYKSVTHASDKTTEQQWHRLTKENLPNTCHTDEQVCANENGFTTETVNTHPGRENSQTCPNGRRKKHGSNKIRSITQRKQVKIVKNKKNARCNPAQGVVDKI
jgi:hypothetical protein